MELKCLISKFLCSLILSFPLDSLGKQLPILAAQYLLLQKIRPPLPRAQQGLLAPPATYSGVVSREKYLWRPVSLENFRPGIVRVLQQAANETLFRYGLITAEYPRYQPGHSVEHDEGGQFAPCENVVADGNFIVDVVVAYPLVNSLISTANQAYVWQSAKLKSDFLFEHPTLGAQENYPHRRISGPDAGDGSSQGFRFHHHTAAAAKRSIISGIMLIQGEIADVGDTDINELPVNGLANNGLAQRRRHHLGKYG